MNDQDQDDPLQRRAEALADGAGVDWERENREHHGLGGTLSHLKVVRDIAELHPAPADRWRELDKFTRTPTPHHAPPAILPDLNRTTHIAQDCRDCGNAGLILVARVQCNFDGTDLPESGLQFGNECRSNRGGCAGAGTDKHVLSAGGLVELNDISDIITAISHVDVMATGADAGLRDRIICRFEGAGCVDDEPGVCHCICQRCRIIRIALAKVDA